MPKISVALATYNGAKFLREQVDSLLAQNYPDFNIIVCDDASTDSTVAILQDYQARFPERVRLIEGSANIGCAANFERGIRAATGEYIALCDQDDVWLPSKLSQMMALFREDASLVFCDLEIVDEALRPLGYGMWRSLGLSWGERRRLNGNRAYEVLLRRSVVSGCGMIIRREIALAALPFPARDYNVHDQWLARIASFQGAIVPCARRLVLYRQHRAQQAGGALLGVGEVAAMAERRFDHEVVRRRWEIFLGKLEELGIGGEGLAYARDWSREHIELERARAEALSIRLILGFAIRGIYGRHFSGLRSFAKDLLRLAGKSR